MDSNSKGVDTVALAQQIAQGIADEDNNGIALRTVQIALGAQLVQSMQVANDGVSRLNGLLDKCLGKFVKSIEDKITADTIGDDELFEIIDKIQSKQLSIANLQRQVVQSTQKIFPDDLLSTDERKLLTLLKSFKSPAEKQAFLKAVQSALEPKESNDFDA